MRHPIDTQGDLKMTLVGQDGITGSFDEANRKRDEIIAKQAKKVAKKSDGKRDLFR